MNIENFKRALAHMKTLDESQFSFCNYVNCDSKELDEWLGVKGSDELSSNRVRNAFRKFGEVPCGTVACLAGEIWLEFAESDLERNMAPPDFSRRFLGLDSYKSEKLFISYSYYGRNSVSQVALQDVIRKLEYLIDNPGEIQ